MRKSISFIVLICLCLSISVANAESEVKLHNGLQFGMTSEEVYERETEKFEKVQAHDIDAPIEDNFIIDINSPDEIADVFNRNDTQCLYFLYGSVAGIADSRINASFWNNELFDICYILRDFGEVQEADYKAIEEALDSTYGNATIVEKDGKSEAHYFTFLPDEYHGFSHASSGLYGSASFINNQFVSQIQYTMRYVENTDKSVVLIVHVLRESDGELMHSLEYLCFDAETMDGRIEKAHEDYNRNHSIDTDEMDNDI